MQSLKIKNENINSPIDFNTHIILGGSITRKGG